MVCLPDNSILAMIMLICKSWQDALSEMLVQAHSCVVNELEHCVQVNLRSAWAMGLRGVLSALPRYLLPERRGGVWDYSA